MGHCREGIGAGALVGGGANFVAVRSLAKHADQFFSRLPYSAIDTTAVEVDGFLTSAEYRSRFLP